MKDRTPAQAIDFSSIAINAVAHYLKSESQQLRDLSVAMFDKIGDNWKAVVVPVAFTSIYFEVSYCETSAEITVQVHRLADVKCFSLYDCL